MKVGILPNDDDSCGWCHTLPPPATPLTGEHGFDHVVLGAGFAGLATARQLAKHLPERSVALIDAQRVGQGASGRNSGFIIDLPHSLATAKAGLRGLTFHGRRHAAAGRLAEAGCDLNQIAAITGSPQQ